MQAWKGARLCLMILLLAGWQAARAGETILTPTFLDVSPGYPWAGEGEFDKDYPPTTEPDKIKWTVDVDMPGGVVDLLDKTGRNENVAAFGRIFLMSDKAVKIDLGMGSDDGLKAWVNGKEVHSNNTMRGVEKNADHADASLNEGLNVLLFRVTQGGGGFGLQVEVAVQGDAKVKQINSKEADQYRQAALDAKRKSDAASAAQSEEEAKKAAQAAKERAPDEESALLNILIAGAFGLASLALFGYVWWNDRKAAKAEAAAKAEKDGTADKKKEADNAAEELKGKESTRKSVKKSAKKSVKKEKKKKKGRKK